MSVSEQQFSMFRISSDKHKIIWISCVLVSIIVAVYFQVVHHQFLNLDDDAYVTGNPRVISGISGTNIIWAFSAFDYIYWQPVTWLSHMFDVQFFGMNPGGHHLTNVLIHAVSSVLLLLLLVRLSGAIWQSSFVAFMFALHPLHVESVAWVAERKDVLSALFWILTLMAYAEFSERRKPFLYVSTLVFFLLGLMSKPMVLTLPVVMLLIDFWPLSSCGKGSADTLQQRMMSLIIEKIPFIACSLLSVAITIFGHDRYGGVRTLREMPLQLRIENALTAYIKYIGKTVWPTDLAVLYPFPASIPLWQAVGSLLLLVIISATAVCVSRRYPYVAMGWFWFLISLLPVIGLVQAGNQSMADRFTYIPGIGLFVIAAWGIPDLLRDMRAKKAWLTFIAGLLITVSTVLTWRQLGYWRDNVTLYRHTLSITNRNEIIHNNLGLALASGGDFDAAILEYTQALSIDPNLTFAYNNLGFALAKKGLFGAAIPQYYEALRRTPNYAEAHNNLGIALANKGDLETAIIEYRQALRIKPDYADPHYNLGLAYAARGDLDGAISEYRQALMIAPFDIDALNNLGAVLAGKGELDGAISSFQSVLRIRPDSVSANNNLQRALMERGARKSVGQ